MRRDGKLYIYWNLYDFLKRSVRKEGALAGALFELLWPIVLVAACGLAIMVAFTRPLPPTKIRLATGQPNSSLDKLGKAYAEKFKAKGVLVELVNTRGAYENMELIKTGKVDTAFSLGGIPLGSNNENIESLGSVEYQPFWLFYRKDRRDTRETSDFFRDRKFSINVPGSGTRFLSEKIFSLHGIPVDNNPNLLSGTSASSVSALLSGGVDGVFLNAGIDSSAIHEALGSPAVEIFDFAKAEAYTRHLKFLEVVNLPYASMDIARNIPSRDVRMVATTTTILVHKDLHAAIQVLFLTTAKSIYQTDRVIFKRKDGFPAIIDRDTPLSNVAERYYAEGPPILFNYLPYWISAYISQMWFYIFAVIAVSYPISKLPLNYRTAYRAIHVASLSQELTLLEKKALNASSGDQLRALETDIELLESRLQSLLIPDTPHSNFNDLSDSIEALRARISRMSERTQEQCSPET
jgi:TRAP-type uncharacterized transport system substrate-binding protein